MNVLDLFATLTALVAATTYVTELGSRLIGTLLKRKVDGFSAQVLSWVVATALSLAGAGWDLGMFAVEPFTQVAWWLAGILTGVVTALAANQVFDTETAKKILEIALARAKKK